MTSTGAQLAAAESIMSGTTTVNTMCRCTAEENEVKACADAGLRGVVDHVCFSWRKKKTRKHFQTWLGTGMARLAG
jgi:cytosine/adenosine deaminase-related metal-dependent hydrolase